MGTDETQIRRDEFHEFPESTANHAKYANAISDTLKA
jgi:hypothetical protein